MRLIKSVTVSERVLARWTNNLYYTGKISSIGGGNIHVSFDDGDKITHKVQDVSAVVSLDNGQHGPMYIGQHVLTNWKGGKKYYIGYVTAKAPDSRYTVTFDDNDEDSYHAEQLTEFPEHLSAHKGK